MKINVVSFAVFLTYLVAHTAAYIALDAFPDVVHLGESYTLTWTATGNYVYELWLIRMVPGQTWQKVSVLADDFYIDSLQGHYDWTVQSNLTIQGDYVLWLQGMVVPYNGHGYPNLTSTFNITSAHTSTGASGDGSHTGISKGAIAGIAIGGVLLLALVVSGFLLCAWRRRRAAVGKRQAAARATRLEPVVKESFPSYAMQGRSS